MIDSQAITLYTSIPPKMHRMAGDRAYGDAYQKECINSWISAGFRVVSINPGSEIAYLANKYPQVRFEDSGSEDVRTGIHVFLRKMLATGEPLSGIMNADCYLTGFDAIFDTICANAEESIVLLRRLNIDPRALRPIGSLATGFDAFFFDTKFLADIEDSKNWKIGQPWWDFWFPIAMYFAGARIRTLDVPALLHLDHEQRWDQEEWVFKAGIFRDTLRNFGTRLNGDKKTPQGLKLCGVDLSDERQEPTQMWAHLLRWVQLSAETIRLSSEDLAGNFLGKVLMGLEESQEASLRHLLETVTFRQWLGSKRASAHRLRNRIRGQLSFLNPQSPRVESTPTGKQ